jgi:hypothetical protein
MRSPTTHASRCRFLEASAGAVVATWLAPAELAASQASATSIGGDRLLETLPFVGEDTFPLDTTVGAGLGRRRAGGSGATGLRRAP